MTKKADHFFSLKNVTRALCTVVFGFLFSSLIYAQTWEFYNTSTGRYGTIQTFTVPSTGSYEIEVWGAKGGPGAQYYANGPEGYGAYMKGNFTLTAGTVLQILVGQMGSYTSYSPYYGGGGGGGTFVAVGSSYSSATPLIVAGGGGGGGENANNNRHGHTGTNGHNGMTTGTPGIGGTNGYGAYGGTYGGNAGGFYGNGSGSWNYYGEIGIGFRNGGNGGGGTYGGNGGFGGGGGGYGGAGGGGGYSGGGGGGWSNGGAGGGGGSYCSGTSCTGTTGTNSGHGKVKITSQGVSNEAPSVQDTSASGKSGQSISITLLGTDPENDNLTYSIVDSPSNGTISISGSTATFTPASTFLGVVTFTYRANDGSLNSDKATVTVIVVPDFSTVVDAQIGQASGLDSLENNLKLWLDATNIDGENNAGYGGGGYTALGSPQGECRQANGNYPLEFSKTYSDLNPHTTGSNAAIAKQRCEETCSLYSWCLAIEVVTRDIWPSPECRMITDYNTYVNASDQSSGENYNFGWGVLKSFGGENWQTYCNGGGACDSSIVWGGGSIYVRDGYSCYVRDGGGSSPVATWMDLSGNGNNGVQTNSSLQPSYSDDNGISAVEFEAGNYETMIIENLYISTETYDIFLLERNRVAGGGGRSFQSRNINWLLGLWNGNNIAFHPNGWVYYGGTSTTNWHIANGSSDGANKAETLYFNGNYVASVNTSGSAPGSFAISGGGEYSNVNMSEILVFDRVLSDQERAVVNHYLAKKGEITASIDSDGDGFLDSVEISSGTSPIDSTSYPAPPTNITVTNGTLITPTITSGGSAITLSAEDNFDLNGDKVLVFKYQDSNNNGSGQTEYELNFSDNIMGNFLVVAGGAAGGGAGGAGGGGDVIEVNGLQILGSYKVKVGKGGSNTGEGCGAAENGSNSQIEKDNTNFIVAAGGGGGGIYGYYTCGGNRGLPAAVTPTTTFNHPITGQVVTTSGGGGGVIWLNRSPGSGNGVSGNGGINSDSNSTNQHQWRGGAGGGAAPPSAGNGGDTYGVWNQVDKLGKGGDGIKSTITGVEIGYGGGGAGGQWNPDANISYNDPGRIDGGGGFNQDAEPHRGGGGSSGRLGGSGVVIVRYYPKVTLAENSGTNVVVTTLGSVDPNENDTATFSIVGGDTSDFTLSGSNLVAVNSFDYETKSSYSVTIRATDSLGLYFEKTILIEIEDVNESPSDVNFLINPTITDTNTGNPVTLAAEDNIKLSDGSTVLVFKNTGSDQTTYNVTFPESIFADVLIVGGGGAGGTNSGGGGGAGGLVFGENISLSSSDQATVTVGKGGVSNTSNGQKISGYNSLINLFGTNIIALGGGGGITGYGTGGNGGSGGGGAAYPSDLGGGASTQTTSYTVNGFTFTGFGSAGGLGRGEEMGGWTRAGAGGGGAGSAGYTSGNYPTDTGQPARITHGGQGGIGKNYSSIFGSSVGDNGWFAGGGGGSIHDNADTQAAASFYRQQAGAGGLGGGGKGGSLQSTSGGYGAGVAGMSHTGGGGGAGHGGDAVGGTGGSGVVLIKYYGTSILTVESGLGSNVVIAQLGFIDPDANDSATFSIVGGDTGDFTLNGSNLIAVNSFDYAVKSSYSLTIRVTDSGGLYVDKTLSINVKIDFSSAVDAQIGQASGLDSVEPNLKLWLDATNINANNNTGIADGAAISEWMDLSGNGHDLNKSNLGTITYNSAGTFLYFDLSSMKSSTIFDQQAIYIVHKTMSGEYFIDLRDPNHNQEAYVYNWGNDYETGAWYDALIINGDSKLANGSNRFEVTDTIFTGQKQITHLTGSSMVRSAFNLSQRYTNVQPSVSEFYEILVFSRKLTNEEHTKIQAYLAKKWGLTALVDSDGDGFLDSVEISSGTSPIDSTSYPAPPTNITVTNGTLITPTITSGGSAITLSAEDNFDLDGDKVLVFKYQDSNNNGIGQTQYEISFTENSIVNMLVVAGGGGGGAFGGGGGAGGVLFSDNLLLTNGSYPILVGKGGIGQKTYNNGVNGENGKNSSVLVNNVELLALGGGGGGTRQASPYYGRHGTAGGSGGAGSHSNSGQYSGGASLQLSYSINNSTIEGFGNIGGKGRNGTGGGEPSHASGGGGGAGYQGEDAIQSTIQNRIFPTTAGGGDGGAGKDFSKYFGSTVGDSGWFAGGGGGNTYYNAGRIGWGNSYDGTHDNNRGLGGGGDGGFNGSPDYNATHGMANTGGGGGGGYTANNSSGDGGSGVVIVRYYPKLKLAENSGTNVVVTTLGSVDPNENDTATFSIVGGDTSDFTISGSNLVAVNSFDYETKSSYKVKIRVTDSIGLYFEKTILIEIEDVNESPSDVNFLINPTITDTNTGNPVTLAAEDNIKLSDGSTVLVFKNTGSDQTNYSISFPSTILADVLIVAGGGSGGVRDSGAGGAGGLIFLDDFSIDSFINLGVGRGGSAIIASGPHSAGNKGKNSFFQSESSSYTAEGGGRGGSWNSSNNNSEGNGGSGGGGGGNWSAGGLGNQPGSSSGGFGYNGAQGSGSYSGGGGGGAGGTGTRHDGDTGGNGGIGKDYSNIFGTTVGEDGWFAGGGGSGSGSGAHGTGGVGGGGDGASDGAAESGMPHTGGGGGSHRNSGGTSGSGGSGVVLIKYSASSILTVESGLGSNVVIAQLGFIDPDANDSATFSIVGGDTGDFTLNGSNLIAVNSFDYTVKSLYSLTIRVTDSGGLYVDKTLSINVKIDFSATVDAQIGQASGLDSVEANLKLWLDATNIDGSNNASYGGGDSAYSALGSPQGECRQASGSYPLKFSKTYSDLNPHTTGSNAAIAKQRCEETCSLYSWCVAVEVVTRDIWPSPECRMVTDYNIYVSASDQSSGENYDFGWGVLKSFGGENWQTYCNGGGACDSSIKWGGGSIYVRDGYSCYVKENGGGASTVATWTDLSGNNNNANQGSSSIQPSYIEDGLNSKPTVDFDGDKYLITQSFDSTNEVTVFAVFQQKNTWGDWGYLFGHGNRDSNWVFEQMGSSTNFNFQTANDNSNVLILANFNEPYLMTGKIENGNTRSLYLHSQTGKQQSIKNYVGGSKITENSVFRIGYSQNGSEYSDVKVSELIYFTKALTDSEIYKINHYLAKKWGLTALVDSDGDGVEDAYDTDPIDPTEYTTADLSTVADAQLGEASGLDSVEPNLKLWLDAKNINNINNSGLASNDLVSKWIDLSENGYVVTQTSTNSQPKYITNSVFFDGSNDYLWSETSETLTDATLILVTKLGGIDFASSTNSGGAAVTIQQKGADNFDAIVYHEHENAHRKFMHGSSGHSRLHISAVTETTTGPFIIQDESKTGQFKQYRNGKLESSANITASSKNLTRFIIGNRHFTSSSTSPVSNGYWWGDIYEVMIINRIITDSERASIHHYLAKKWGLTATVDSDGDGVEDAYDTDPIDPTEYTTADLSTAVDAQLGEASGLDSIEANLKLWLDAANVNNRNNSDLNDNDPISKWIDLSETGNNAIQSDTNKQPKLLGTQNSLPVIEYEVGNQIIDGNGAIAFAKQSLNLTTRIESKTVYVVAKQSVQGAHHLFGDTSYFDFHRGIDAANSQSYGGEAYGFLYGHPSVRAKNGDFYLNGIVVNPLTTVVPINEYFISSFKTSGDPMRLNRLGEERGVISKSWAGSIAEIVIFDQPLAANNHIYIQHYLAKKWGLTSIVDSDGDGFLDSVEISAGTSPIDISSYPVPDFSDHANEKIGSSSGLDSIESNLKLWLDSSNINAKNNSGISNGASVSRWLDLSGNGNVSEQSSTDKQPRFTSNGMQFDDYDFMVMKAFAEEFSDGDVFFVMQSPDQPSYHQGGFHSWGHSAQHFSGSGYQMVEIFGINENSTVSQSIGGNSPCAGNRFCWDATNIDLVKQRHIINYSAKVGDNNWETFLNGDVKVRGTVSSTNFTGNGYNKRNYTFVGDSQVTTQLNYLGASWMTNGDGTAPSESHYIWNGAIAEVLFFNKKLSLQERAQVNHYLAKKWGLTSLVDSDGDGVEDAYDTNPIDPTEYTTADLSTAVDAELGEASGLDSIEANLKLWLDATNTNSRNNSDLNDNDPISKWIDLSETGNNATQTNSAASPVLKTNALNSKSIVKFDGSNDVLNLPDGTVPGGNNSYTVISVVKAATSHHGGILGSGSYGSENKVNAFRFDQNSKLINYWWVNDVITDTDQSIINNYIIASFKYNNQIGRTIYVNGGNKKSSSTINRASDSINVTLGKTYNTEYLNGDIVEIMIFDQALNSDQLIKINHYLAKKWGLTETVDSDGDTITDAVEDGDTSPIDPLEPPQPNSLNEVYVDFSTVAKKYGSAESPVNTMQKAVNAIIPGGTIYLYPGTTTESLLINKNLKIRSVSGSAKIGVDSSTTDPAQ